ncbi:MAG: glycosyltransferase family 2 protein [Acidimicrobiia bacterium]|nr:glycosyltransferase family 2 protein [Acidimicrobiia bacterium]
MTIIGALLLFVVGLDAVSNRAREGLELIVVAVLFLAAAVGFIEALAALRMPKPPPHPEVPLPSTTAIIAAYLPNEADLIVETIEHHLQAGPPDLQVIVAYNTPTPLDVEFDLLELAQREPRLVVLQVEHSTSKAENVNAALAVATGEIIGVFDADHHPQAGSYQRAWRWMAADVADVVQGRCAVRMASGKTRRSFLDIIVTAEFEQIYTVSHPGRTRLQGFGIFGGSNGYWRAESLRAMRLDPTALTEDIDASVRLLRSGGRIITDPGIVSGELAPPSLRALCHQRLRWSQGWFQVARRHLGALVADESIGVRSRIGSAWLFGTAAVMPWIGALTIPVSIQHFLFPSNASSVRENIGLFGQYAATLPAERSPFIGYLVTFGMISFLTQAAVAFRHALPGSRRLWIFAPYVVASAICFSHLRTACARLSHVRELSGQADWKVTPRTAGRAAAAAAEA